MFKVSFNALDILSFTRGSVYIRYFDKTKSKKETNELNEVELIYYFSNDCDVFEGVKNLFHLAKDRVKLFTSELNNIQQLINNQSGSTLRKVTVHEVLELNALAFYEEAKGFNLKKKYKLSKFPYLSFKKELEQATLYFLNNFGLMSEISFQFKFYFWLNISEEKISSNLYPTKQSNSKTFDKHTKEIIKILSKPNLFNFSLFAEIKETF